MEKCCVVFLTVIIILSNFSSNVFSAESPIEFENSWEKTAIINSLKKSMPEKYGNYDENSDIYLSDYKNIIYLEYSDGRWPWSQMDTIMCLDKMSNLEELTVKGYVMTELDLSKNKKLRKLTCSMNALSELDLSNNPELIELDCKYNNLKKLDLSNNNKIESVDCSQNWIEDINVSNCINLYNLQCSENCLRDINIDPQIGWEAPEGKTPVINISQNYIDSENNEILSEKLEDLKVKLESKSGNVLCGTGYGDSPDSLVKLDPSFEYELMQMYQNISSDPMDWSFTREGLSKFTDLYFMTYVELLMPILNLSGIECFTNLTSLSSEYDIKIRELDLSQNKKLKNYGLRASKLENLIFKDNTEILSLYCPNGSLTNLDLSGCINLTSLDCSNNNLSELDLSSTPGLSILKCSNNILKTLDVSNNIRLFYFMCNDNEINNLILNENAEWKKPDHSNYSPVFDIHNNYLDISDGSQLKEKLSIIEPKIMSGGTEQNPAQFIYSPQKGDGICWSLSLTNENGIIKCIAENVANKSQNSSLILSYYSEDEILEYTEIKNIVAGIGESIIIDADIPESKKDSIKTIRAFVWNNIEQMSAESMYSEFIVDKTTNK